MKVYDVLIFITVALVYGIGECQSKTIANALKTIDEHNLRHEELSFNLRVPHKQAISDLPGEPLNMTDFLNAEFIRDELDPYEMVWTRKPSEGSELFEGDIAGITAYDIIGGRSASSGLKGLVQNNAVNEVDKRWKDGMVPYVISAAFRTEERSLIAKAIKEFHNSTCLRFVPRKAFHRDFLKIVKADGCYSMVGRHGGPQVVSLGAGCFQLGTIIHEFMHAIGFWHEHSRSDRDDHISIRWENIVPGMEHNFGKLDKSEAHDLGAAYDLGSVMHYGAYAFAKDDNSPTIFPKTDATIGQRNHFSEIDLIKINRLYECTPMPVTTTPLTLTPSTSPAITSDVKCSNSHHYCSQWAEDGECTHNPEYMKVTCPKSCGYCQTKTANENNCEDSHRYCRAWAERGQCRLNPTFMLPYCRKSCGEC